MKHWNPLRVMRTEALEEKKLLLNIDCIKRDGWVHFS